MKVILRPGKWIEVKEVGKVTFFCKEDVVTVEIFDDVIKKGLILITMKNKHQLKFLEEGFETRDWEKLICFLSGIGEREIN